MSNTSLFVIVTLVLFLVLSTTAHFSTPCSECFVKSEKMNMSHCNTLTTLGAEFGWTIREQNESQIDIIFSTRLDADMGWLAWGVNPRNRPQMVGTRAVIGIKHPNGSLSIDTYNITSDIKLGCTLRPSKIDVEVQNMSIEYLAQVDYFAIRATVHLPWVYDISKLNLVWQVGYYVEGVEPKMHPTTLQNVDSTEIINLKTEYSKQVGQHRRHLRKVHGILNIVGWGTVLPAGVVIARYFRYPIEVKEPRWWYYPHVCCQIIGYVLGSTGWSIGLYLGHTSRYYTFNTHRLYAIFIFTFATLQMLALWLRPVQKDEYRKYWNMYHHFLGYALLAVIAVNIFHGIAILKPDNCTWKWAYIAILGMFAIIFTAFEIYTWAKFIKDKSEKKENKINACQSEGGSTVQHSSTPPEPQE